VRFGFTAATMGPPPNAGPPGERHAWQCVMPFVAADVVRVSLLVAFPSIALVLPRLM
jgi:hypothetical protein